MAKKKRVKRRKSVGRRKRRMSGDQSFTPNVISGRRRSGIKHRKRRRKKVSGLTGSDNGDLIVGGLMGVIAGVVVDRINPIDARVGDGFKILAGGALAVTSKDPLFKGVGLGIAFNGLTTGSHNFGLVHGIDEALSGLGLLPEGKNKDEMLIEMSGMEEDERMSGSGVDINSTKFIRGGSSDQPKIVSGNSQSPMGNMMPNVVNGGDY